MSSARIVITAGVFIAKKSCPIVAKTVGLWRILDYPKKMMTLLAIPAISKAGQAHPDEMASSRE
jgi:hypothetical protein